MNKRVLAVALAAIGLPASALAGGLEDRLAAMEARMAQLESRVIDQSRELEARNARIAQLESAAATAPATGGGGAWFQRVNVSGLVEIDANHVSPANGADTSDITAHKLELMLDAQINDWVAAAVMLKYEEETDNDGKVEIEDVKLTLADPAGPWFVNAGQFVLPFGVFDTFMLADPITKELGETLDSAVEVGVHAGAFTVSAYAFQGDRETTVSNFGLSAGVETEANGVTLAAQLGYLNDMAETNAIVDGAWVGASDPKVGAWIASAALGFGDFHLIAEYLTATDEFASAGNDKPSVYNLEAAYDFAALGQPATVALGFQGSHDAHNAVWELPERRVLGTVSTEIAEGTRVGLEVKRDTDYAGDKETTVTGRLSVEF